ncbi:MAG: DUF4115 domain-containing protein [Anaerolineae bacterium]|nr:DUF4115 domain-containing protein [Anaerolineae bacterium]
MTDELGSWLRRKRESQQLTLSDAEKALRIRRRYLEALEVGDYAALPGEIQARGFLRNYARYLGLPAEEALARYDVEVRGRPITLTPVAVQDVRGRAIERPSVFSPPPSEEEEVASVRAGIPRAAVWAILAVLIFFLLVLFGSLVWLQLEKFRTQPSVTPIVTLSPMQSTPTEVSTSVPPVFVPSADGRVNLRLMPNEHVWISLSADERIVFQGIAEPGQILEASAEEILIAATGNGGAFQLYINGTDWGPLGAQGAIVRRAWSPTGEVFLEGE